LEVLKLQRPLVCLCLQAGWLELKLYTRSPTPQKEVGFRVQPASCPAEFAEEVAGLFSTQPTIWELQKMSRSWMYPAIGLNVQGYPANAIGGQPLDLHMSVDVQAGHPADIHQDIPLTSIRTSMGDHGLPRVIDPLLVCLNHPLEYRVNCI